MLKRRRIYILPTRFGAIFALMVFVMLLGSLNYSASLGFMLTFLLAGLGLVLMHHCHGNLLGGEIKLLGAHPVFAGERAEFRVALRNDTGQPRYEIELAHQRHATSPVDVAPGAQETLRIAVPTERRGWVDSRAFRGRHTSSRRALPRVDVGAHGRALPRIRGPRRPGDRSPRAPA